MGLMIEGGDFVLDERGRLLEKTAIDELLQRALARLAVPKGSFAYDRQLGSELWTLRSESENLQGRAFVLAREALATLAGLKLHNVNAQQAESGQGVWVSVELAIDGDLHTLGFKV